MKPQDDHRERVEKHLSCLMFLSLPSGLTTPRRSCTPHLEACSSTTSRTTSTETWTTNTETWITREVHKEVGKRQSVKNHQRKTMIDAPDVIT